MIQVTKIDVITINEIGNIFLLFLLEVAEICILVSWGYTINSSTIVNAYPDTYKAHLIALEIELEETLKDREWGHVRFRHINLESYLNDSLLPNEFKDKVKHLLKQHCIPPKS